MMSANSSETSLVFKEIVCLTDRSLAYMSLNLANDYGLIRVEDIPSKSVWMENNRKLDYYMIRDGVSKHYSSNFHG